MAAVEFGERTVSSVVEQYVDSRKSTDSLISTRQALRALRAAMPACDLTDRELADMVASRDQARAKHFLRCVRREIRLVINLRGWIET